MRKRKQLSDEELRRSVRELLKQDTAYFMMHDLKPEHQFSDQFIEKMTPLLQDMKRGTVKAAEYFMGWQYYAKQGIAAVLICFLLACAAMPEAVLAGYHKLIEVVETIYEEYTEFRYSLENTDEAEFKAIKLKYLPNDFKEVERIEKINSLNLLYNGENEEYFIIYQKMITEHQNIILGINTEKAKTKELVLNEGILELTLKDGKIYFVYIIDRYRISGQTNLSEEEVINILKQASVE